MGNVSPRTYLTLGQTLGQGQITLNPYHYQNYGEDLHDGLAATLHLRDSGEFFLKHFLFDCRVCLLFHNSFHT